jgi:hypothetical protein
MSHGHVKPNLDGTKARCGGPGVCPECSMELHRDIAEKRKEKLLDVILAWQHAWMDVRGTDERDRMSYFNKAAGIDANMRHDLARRLLRLDMP